MEAFIGTIILFGGAYTLTDKTSDPSSGPSRGPYALSSSYAPEDWAYCDGRTLSVHQYQALYSILGTKYGGNGRTEFSLPNLPGVKTADGEVELKYIICLNGLYPAR